MQVSISNKYILKSAVPIALAMLIPVLNNLTNNYFLGKVGERALAVNGVAGIFYLILAMVGYGLATGIQMQFSRKAAQNDYLGIARQISNGIFLSLALAALLLLLSLTLAPLIFRVSLHAADHISMSGEFLKIRSWGLPFLMLTQLANAFYISIGKSQYLLAGSITTTLINIVLDYCFILGHFGAPEMGLNGAALASAIAELCGWAVMWSLFFKKDIFRQFPLGRKLRPDLRLCSSMLKISAPLIVQYFFSIGGWQVFFIFVEHLGEKELAASQILRPIFGVIGTSSWAFATTCNTMVSNVIGQGKASRVPGLIKKVAGLSIVASIIQCSILILLGRQYLQLFTADDALVTMALPSLYIISVGTVVMSMSTVMFNGIVGTGNTRVNLLIEVGCVGVYLLYCFIVIQQMRLGLTWAWGSEFVYWTSLFVTAFLYLRTGRWRGKVV